MSSGFVSAGTIEQPVERDDEWLKAQQEIEAKRRRKEEESRQEGGKTLYEVLQSNKAAKQEAFEESIRLKNQFRNLDDDEVEFLDSVLESTRRQEEQVKKQTSEQLTLFRQQQEEADRATFEDNSIAKVDENDQKGEPEERWIVNRGKRKRSGDKKGLPGFKLHKTSIPSSTHGVEASAKHSSLSRSSPPTKAIPKSQIKATLSSTPAVSAGFAPSDVVDPPEVPGKPGPSNLGLAGYSSDEED